MRACEKNAEKFVILFKSACIYSMVVFIISHQERTVLVLVL